MARKVEVLLVDDVDGEDADETVTFSIDGTSYEIDLSKKNAAKLRSGLEPFVTSARKTHKAAGRGGRRVRPVGRRERSAEIREWAKNNGLKVNDRGRIPAHVIEQFESR
ncbi:histone-like nucleoid-structuring protein Lsr2 [Actinomadura coerulea]|uniref:histone-like nucleoid-structuring protein Lsr2 n=1 Tax=Actinomadura coerulea TaxID=46159 RepID=UPI00343A516E